MMTLFDTMNADAIANVTASENEVWQNFAGPTPQDETAERPLFLCPSPHKCCDWSRFYRRKALRKLVVCWLMLVPVAGLAASGEEFYQRLYERGMAHFAAGDYAAAFTELRNAAFGFVEQVDTFETAQAYAVIAAHRLSHDDDARDSLMRIVTAEKVQPHFRSVKLPDALRAEIHALAVALLTAEEAALIPVSGQAPDAAAEPKPPVAPTADADPKPARPQQPAPTPQPVTPVPQPVAPPPQPVSPAPKPQTRKHIVQPQSQPVAPAPKTKAPAAEPSPGVDGKFVDAQRAIDDGDVGRARSIYAALLAGPPLAHDQVVRLAEGLYNVRDFAGAVQAFQRVGSFGQGEEPFRYDYAVALYETGHYKDAKRELAAALPFIPATADVARNRAKIEGAIE
jgi:Flp pilus assembly protein TadD